MEQYKLALVQMNCAFGEQEQNRKKAEQYIREAAKKGAALVCFQSRLTADIWAAEFRYESNGGNLWMGRLSVI